MGKLPPFSDENLLVGVATSDDAAVYRVADDLAMIQTVDFFTPVVDDPYVFGQIAAANALSDAYAMGGAPRVALNVVGFPSCPDPEILGQIMAGGADKVKEAGAILIGGHSIQTEEPIYGLCVSGFVHPDRIWRNFGARPGDALILTKQLGSGVVNTAVKGGLASDEATAEASDVTLCLEAGRVPLIGEALDYASMGLVPAGAYRNRGYYLPKVDVGDTPEERMDLLFDPQTSGGLLVSLDGALADKAMERLADAGLETAGAVIGYAAEKSDKLIRLV